MKHNKTWVYLLALLVACTSSVGATTCCDQVFTVKGKTAGDYGVIVWRIDVGGECLFTEAQFLFTAPEGAHLLKMRMGDNDKWPDGFLSDARAETMFDAVDSSGVFRLNDSIVAYPPLPDTLFPLRYQELAQYQDAGSWYKNCPVECIDYPRFLGCEAKLVYTHAGGLYKNYKLKSVTYFPESGYVVIVIDQPMKAAGLDTMHGLFVFKLLPAGTTDTTQSIPPRAATRDSVPRSFPPSIKTWPHGACQQNFTLFAKTAGRHSLMFFRVDWNGGGCGNRLFYTLFILPDRCHSFESTSLIGNWVSGLYENMTLETFKTISDSNGVFRLNDSMSFTNPVEDLVARRMFDSLLKRDTRTWYWVHRGDEPDPPQFRGFQAGPIWWFNGGLYKNYKIKEARYYPASDYLIILTENPVRDDEDRTMNGLLIYSLKDWR